MWRKLVSPGAVVALDVAVELGRTGREFEQVDAAALAFGLEVGLELGASVDLDGFDGEGHVGLELVEEALCVVCGGASPGLGAGPLYDGVMGGELLDGRAAGVWRDGEGVALDDLTGVCGLAALGRAPGVRPEAPDGARPVAAQGRDRRDRAPVHQRLEDTRPVVLSLTACPSRRSRMAILALPLIG